MERTTSDAPATATSADDTDRAWSVEFRAVYRTSHDPLVRLAAMLLGNRAEAEEVVHEAFMAAAGRFPEIDNAGAYIRRSVVNGAHGVLRRRRIADRHRPDPPPPEAPVQLVELRDVLLGLSWNQRTVIVLRFLEGLSVRETADILGCRESTVRSHCRRGLQALRKELSS